MHHRFRSRSRFGLPLSLYLRKISVFRLSGRIPLIWFVFNGIESVRCYVECFRHANLCTNLEKSLRSYPRNLDRIEDAADFAFSSSSGVSSDDSFSSLPLSFYPRVSSFSPALSSSSIRDISLKRTPPEGSFLRFSVGFLLSTSEPPV